MNRLVLFSSALILTLLFSCAEEQRDWLDTDPSDILTDEQVWNNPERVYEVLADLYAQVPDQFNLNDFPNFTDFDFAFPSSYGDYGRVENTNYAFDSWSYWDYGYIRDINLFLRNAREAESLSTDDREEFMGEAHFLRANAYFELVKRMGGVPILKDTMQYNGSENPTYLQHSRSKEAEVYDFIIDELDSAAAVLPQNPSIKSRATWGAAMALKSRAALYAASIADHGGKTPNVSLADGVVGIPSDRKEEYYRIALNAAETLIKNGSYNLYNKFPEDLENNFAQIFIEKGNDEVIWHLDHNTKDVNTQFTVQNQPHSSTEEGSWSGVLNPSLNFVQTFEKLDNTFSPIRNMDNGGNLIKYDNIDDIFDDRDARLGGTVILPGSQFRGQILDIWAGYQFSDGTILSGSNFGERKDLPNGDHRQVVGKDGPIDDLEHGTQTGFYLRKYNDPQPGHGEIGTGSDLAWIRIRYAEVLLNAAEAAFGLGDLETAAEYVNKLRERAGFKIPLSPSEISFGRIVHERYVELAFEGHRLWDLKRWRLAHKVWDGSNNAELNAHPEQHDASSTRQWALYPYRIFNPGNSDDGKWIFKRRIPSAVKAPRNFRIGNYYSRIANDILSNNPKLIQNPNQ